MGTLALAAALFVAPPAAAELLFAAEGNRLRVIDLASLAGGELAHAILIERAGLDPENGRDINGMICALPSGRFVAGEDTGQPGVPPGWGLLTHDGRQLGKLAPTAFADQSEPYGCAVDAEGRLFTSELGDAGFGGGNGQLLLWFPPFDRFPGTPGSYPNAAHSQNYCKLATDLGTAGGVVIDASGRVYVASSSDMQIHRFSPPFPTAPHAAGGCGERDALGSPVVAQVRREIVTGPHWSRRLVTWSGLAPAPGGGLYAASVATGRIAELDLDGNVVQMVLEPDDGRLFGWLPPFATGTPQGLAVDGEGNLYYADLDLQWDGWRLEPGPDGKLWRIGFDARGEPLAPEVVLSDLAFPDGLGVLPGRLEAGRVVIDRNR